jgi:hypothetical protein
MSPYDDARFWTLRLHNLNTLHAAGAVSQIGAINLLPTRMHRVGRISSVTRLS